MRTNKNLIKLIKVHKSEIVKCFFTNARSLLSKLKMEELRMYAKEEKLVILGIAETLLHDAVENSDICIERYSLYRRDRAKIKSDRGGRVVLYV